jgi:putative transcriptional regulator
MKKEIFDELLTSIEQGGTILRGKQTPSRTFRADNPDVSAIRRHLGLTQQKFAELLGISPATLRQYLERQDSHVCLIVHFIAATSKACSC